MQNKCSYELSEKRQNKAGAPSSAVNICCVTAFKAKQKKKEILEVICVSYYVSKSTWKAAQPSEDHYPALCTSSDIRYINILTFRG